MSSDGFVQFAAERGYEPEWYAVTFSGKTPLYLHPDGSLYSWIHGGWKTREEVEKAIKSREQQERR